MITSESKGKYTKPLLKNEMGHWTSKVKVNPSEAFGFLYCIQNKSSNQFYWGKKQFWRVGKKASAKGHGKESLWRTYIGSSTHLQSDIKTLGYDSFNFEIVDVYKTKGGLYYSEAYSQMVSECLTERLPDGKTPRFYNRVIGQVRFIPKEAITETTKKYIKAIKKRY